jgi:Amt family ammonium transporter
MTPETAAVAYVGVLAALGVALAIVLVLPSLHRSGWRLLVLAAICGGEVVVLGLVTGAAAAPYLVDVAAAGAVVLELLLAAATAAGAGPRARWLVPVVWGAVVLPVTALAPLIVTKGCAGTSCELLDFGATVPLALAPAAFLLLAVVIPRRARRPLPAPGTAGSLVLGGASWLGFVAWIAAMEGIVDAYTPVLLIAGAVGPGVGALTWLVADRLRRSARPPARSVALGVLTGAVAATAGAALVRAPWSVAVAVLATLVAAMVVGRAGGSVSRHAWAVLGAAVVGLLAPAISGESVGILFTADLDVVPVPLIAGAACAGAAVLTSLPVWLVIRIGVSRTGSASQNP